MILRGDRLCQYLHIFGLVLLGVVYSFSCLAATTSYNEALDKSKEALYIQSGAKDFVGRLENYGKDKGLYYLDKIYLKDPILIAGYGYRIYKEKSIKIPYHGKKIILNPNSVKLEIPF